METILYKNSTRAACYSLLIILISLSSLHLHAQESEPFFGLKLRSFLETEPVLSGQNLSGDDKISADEFSAFLNIGYDVLPSIVVFHSLEWSQIEYSMNFAGNSGNELPSYFRSLPTLTTIDLSTGIIHTLSKQWNMMTIGTVSITSGSGETNLKRTNNYAGIVLLQRKYSNNSELSLGGFYYSGADESLFLPLISTTFRFGKFGMSGTLPLDVRFFYEFSEKFRLGLGSDLSFSGYRYKEPQTSQNGFPAAKNADLIRLMTGLTFDWRIHRNTSLTLNSGFYNQEYKIHTTSGKEETFKFKDSLFAGLTINYIVE